MTSQHEMIPRAVPAAGRTRRRRSLSFGLTLVAAFGLCGVFAGSGFGQGGRLQGDDCDTGLEPQSLQDFTKQCTAFIGEQVPDLDCDAGTPVPDTHGSGAAYPNEVCDRPNVLNHVCDPGSKFQVLKQTADVAIVAHCRKKGHPGGGYRDIAIIQYNKKNGGTCFYQALGNDLPAKMPSPINGNGPGQTQWYSPKDTADINCVQCHDNGPFIRSPYLAQLRNEAKNRLPGTNGGSGPWDQRFSWNSTLPYSFVGNSFQSWKTYALSITGAGSGCLLCHRLGFSASNGSPNAGRGTAQDFALIATAMTQLHKNPHSADSPIWMTPFQTFYDASTETEAQAAAACASAIVAKLNNPAAPEPPDGCQFAQFGQGNTCRGAPIRGVLNGPTQSTPTGGRTDITLDAGTCTDGKCPPGFCYWTSVHGSFWQTTPFSVPIADPNYRGSFIRIFAENGYWKMRAFKDSTGIGNIAAPGGTFACTIYDEIAAIPDTSKCFANSFSVVDKDGTHPTETTDATVAGASTANVLSGFIGNFAQSNTGGTHDGPDVLRVSEASNKVTLTDQHHIKLPSPLKIGPLQGESWTNGCVSWTANYLAKDVHTTSDVQLLDPVKTKNARCFITGVTGAWSSTRSNGTIQPFAEIYLGANKETRLRVQPTNAPDSVGAYASCIQLK